MKQSHPYLLYPAALLATIYLAAWACPVVFADVAGQAGTSAASPAEVVMQTRLGPAAGNGTRPFAAVVDTRRNRIWVLNQVPLSLSIVDPANQRVIGFVPLSPPQVPEFDAWNSSDPHVWMGYDSRSDRVLVGSGNISVPGVLVSVDAGTCRIKAVRTFLDRHSYRWAINAKRGEVAVAGMGSAYRGGFGMMIMDAKTLATHADLATTRQIEAIAASDRTGQLYTVEPSNPRTAACGIGGPYASTRVFVRNPASGAILSQSAGDYAYPRALFVDDDNNRLYLVHRDIQLNTISNESATVTVLLQSTLRRMHTIRYTDPEPNGRVLLFWVTSFLDAPRHRLIVGLSSGTLAILQLTGTAKAVQIPVEGARLADYRLTGSYRLAGVQQRNGQPLLLIDNAVRLLNARTLKSDASITLGATVQDLFLDGKRHKLLTYVDRDVHEFLMLDGDVPRRLFKSALLPDTHLLGVDFNSESIYSVYDGSRDTVASLQVMNFRGEKASGGYEAEGELFSLIVTGTPGRSIRLLYPAFPENVFALPRHSLDLLTGGRETRSVALLQLSLVEPPLQMLYAQQADLVYLVFGRKMTIYAGSDLAAICTVSLGVLSYDRMRSRLRGALAVDSAGQYAYYADPTSNQIAKLRLADGSIVDRRALAFAPTLPLVDSTANRLYVADNDGGRIVAIRLF